MGDILSWLAKNLSNIMVIITFLIFFIKPLREKFFAKILKDKAERAGICALLRKEIISECKKAQEQGFIYQYDSENLRDMYDSYHSLGGNGGIGHIVEQAELLTVKLHEEK